MGFKYTEDQLKVINLRDRNILVSAAAGSGKTTVLVERIIKRVCDEENPVDIDRLLVLTFTNAAAGEMRERIRVAIDEKLKENPLNEHMQRQATLIHNALITTIHSFCLFLLRNNFNDIGLDPGFRVADEGELKLLKEKVMNDLLEELFGSDLIEGFSHLADRFITGNSMKGLKDIILDVYRYSMSYPFAQDWLEERKQDYRVRDEEQISQTPWGIMLLDMTRQNIVECISLTETSLELAGEADGPYMYLDALNSDLDCLTKAEKCTSLREYKAFFDSLTFTKLSPKKDDAVSQEIKDTVKQIRDMTKGILQDLKKKYYCYLSSAIFVRMEENAKICDCLIDTVKLFLERLNAEKREKKIIDFTDMEHLALQILLTKQDGEYVATKAALDYRDYFKEIMIDEYQDSNLVQEWILKSISGEDDGNYNRFMVGDVKQSIYKFRLACPQLFMEKFDTYQKDGVRQRIDLSQNYRSRMEVIESVNDVFEKLMAKDLGSVSYDNESALHIGASYPESTSDNTSELLLIETEKDSRLTKQEQEAEAISGKIKELVGKFDILDKETGVLRKASYSDIVILLRTNAGWDDTFKRILERFGIPAYIASKTGYFSTNEIRVVMNFLRVLDNPKQDIPLYGTLISTFGGFSEDEIAILRILGHNSLLECVQKCAEENMSTEEILQSKNLAFPVHKCKKFINLLDKYRAMVPYEPIHILLRELFLETGYLYEVSTQPAGEQRRANVMMLLKKAENYEQSSYRGLFHFIHYMEQLQKYEVDFGEAATLDENADVVRIMSIHKSKGLEFPICFVAGLSKKFNMSDARETVIFDSNFGIGLDYVNLEKRVKYPDLRKKILSEKMRQDNLAEEIRVLYVALTRAKEKLILSGMVDDFEKLDRTTDSHSLLLNNKLNAEGQNSLPLFMRLQASTYLEWILDALINNTKHFHISRMNAEDRITGQIQEIVDVHGRKETLLLQLSNRLKTDNENVQKIKETLDFVYPHENLQKLYTKTTVSELKIAAIHDGLLKENREDVSATMFPENEKTTAVPRFAKGKTNVSGTARGSAYHRVMELYDFDNLKQLEKKEQILEQVNNLILQGRITQEEADMVDMLKIEEFLNSTLAIRMSNASKEQNLYLEQPFVLGVNAKRLSDNFPEEETVLVQGIIDVYFIEENEIVLMDYKTDSVKESQELIGRYRTQLLYYTEALEKITGLKVKEKLIYSFALQQVITVV